MWTVPTRVVVAVDGSSSSSSSSQNSFHKDGRKISVGDCALFKPPQDSPPFIGIIRWVTTGKDSKLKLGVNWLYRPSEVKLGKGIPLDAAPNELFYSFHKDEIPAASLLHPCKVAFLPKGVELPSEISSFVCRRLYDVTNKCLWWLTDQDYINERQEEVDQLLGKKRVEMHATVQSGGRSPKPTNGPTSTSQLKAGSESMQNSVSSFSSQVKGKKRERTEQGNEPFKRERITKTDDGDSGHCRQETFLKSEIAKITEKGGLVDLEGVERLVQLMLPERSEKKIDLAGRSMLAGVIAATDKFDCLSEFVQLRGLPVFDEWLQEVHKGKVCDGSGSKESDKSIEEFLLVLLRALDKLPVNLQALQMCNIGKSVNHLRSHKNSEIQKKSRSLVDTWKKRVEAEMNINDMKGVPWPGRPRPEVGNRHSGGSSDFAMKSSVAQVSGSKSASVKIVHGDSTVRSASVSPGSMKSVPSPASASMNVKDGHHRNTGGGSGMSDVPLTPARDEKSSSSSQSHNNSQSCSNDHARNGGVSGKDDARSSSAGSMNANKVSGGSSRPRKSANGFQGSQSGSQREVGSSRNSSLQRNATVEKSSQSGLTNEKVHDGTTAEGNSHNKLIVKIPNRGRSPAQNSGGSFEDPSIMSSRASSPVPTEKHDQFDRSSKDKSDAYRATVTSEINSESWQSNDFKDVLTASDEGDGSPAAVTDEERCRTSDETKKVAEVLKTASSSTGNELKSGNLQGACFNSMHALLESCVQYSEGNAPVTAVDDVGMNLLASVAAGEITDSPLRNTPTEIASAGSNLKERLIRTDDLAQDQSPSIGGADDKHGKHGSKSSSDGSKAKDDKSLTMPEECPKLESAALVRSSSSVSQKAECREESKVKSSDGILASVVVVSPKTSERTTGIERGKPAQEKFAAGQLRAADNFEVNHSRGESLLQAHKIEDVGSGEDVKLTVTEVSSSSTALDTECKSKGKSTGQTDEKSTASTMQSEPGNGDCEGQMPSESGKKIEEKKTEKSETVDVKGAVDESESQRAVPGSTAPSTPENRAVSGGCSGVTHTSSENVERRMEGEEIDKRRQPDIRKVSSTCNVQDAEQLVKSKDSKLTGIKTDEAEECIGRAGSSSKSTVGVSEADAKVEFDLNEGFNADDGKYLEPKSSVPGCPPAGSLISPFPFPVSSVSSGLPASITVAAAAKGPFLPANDLLRSKGELGWKGSAATSAFRPAEPRKALDVSSGATNSANSEPTTGKRPLFDFDLNVPDERVLEDMASRYTGHETSSTSAPVRNLDMLYGQSKSVLPVRSSGGLDLDLNEVDETSEMNYSINNGHRPDAPVLQIKAAPTGTLAGEVGVHRDFDLNDGPVVDELSADPALFGQQTRGSAPSHPPAPSLRANNAEVGNFSSWFNPGPTYPAVSIPSIMPDRGEQPFSIVSAGGPQRMMGPPIAGNPFSPDAYRGPVLSASPAMPFTSTSFQYPVFSYGPSFSMPQTTNFPGGSTTYLDSSSGGRLCFPGVHPQLLGPPSGVASSFPRPYVISLQDGSNNSSSESSRKWGRHGLDLNAGPGAPEIDGREESSTLVPKQLSISGAQALVDEQARMFQIPGGTLKRKEPEGGRESYKQSSWH